MESAVNICVLILLGQGGRCCWFLVYHLWKEQNLATTQQKSKYFCDMVRFRSLPWATDTRGSCRTGNRGTRFTQNLWIPGIKLQNWNFPNALGSFWFLLWCCWEVCRLNMLSFCVSAGMIHARVSLKGHHCSSTGISTWPYPRGLQATLRKVWNTISPWAAPLWWHWIWRKPFHSGSGIVRHSLCPIVAVLVL